MTATLDEGVFEGERALFMRRDLLIRNSIFQNGESPLKECRDITLENTVFKWKYPLWYGENFSLTGCSLMETARAGIWYTRNITMKECDIQAPKTFRRSQGITLEHVTLTNAQETLWHCRDVRLAHVTARGTYFGMDSQGLEIEDLRLDGDYSFDGARDLVIRNSRLLSKDAFWNAENVEVYDSHILGEYLGWNSRNVTLVNCVVESLQGMCYMKDLRMVNCRLINTTLAFEYSTVEAELEGTVGSIKNPLAGRITADGAGEIIFDDPQVDPARTEIILRRGS